MSRYHHGSEGKFQNFPMSEFQIDDRMRRFIYLAQLEEVDKLIGHCKVYLKFYASLSYQEKRKRSLFARFTEETSRLHKLNARKAVLMKDMEDSQKLKVPDENQASPYISPYVNEKQRVFEKMNPLENSTTSSTSKMKNPKPSLAKPTKTPELTAKGNSLKYPKASISETSNLDLGRTELVTPRKNCPIDSHFSISHDSLVKKFVWIIESSKTPFNLMKKFSNHPCQTRLKMHLASSGFNEISISFEKVSLSEENLSIQLRVKTPQKNFNILDFNLKDTSPLKMNNNVLIKNENSAATVSGSSSISGFIVLKGCSCIRKLSVVDDNVTQLKDDFQSALQNGLYTDVVLRVGEDQFPVHKFVLSARSPVFKRMFEQDMKEKYDNCVEIIDVDKNIMQKFIKFMYTGTLHNESCDILLDLYGLADKYNVKTLLKTCRNYLMECMSKNTVIDILHLADLHCDKKLKQNAVEFACRNFMEIYPLPSWKNLLFKNPRLGSLIAYKLSSDVYFKRQEFN